MKINKHVTVDAYIKNVCLEKSLSKRGTKTLSKRGTTEIPKEIPIIERLNSQSNLFAHILLTILKR